VISLVPFEPRFLEGVKVNPSQKQYQYMLENPETFQGAWCGFYGRDLIAIGGGVVVGEEIAGWILFTDKVTPRRFLALHRVIERMIQEWESNGFSFYIHVDPSYKQADRWARLMGFSLRDDEQVEGRTMKRYFR